MDIVYSEVQLVYPVYLSVLCQSYNLTTFTFSHKLNKDSDAGPILV